MSDVLWPRYAGAKVVLKDNGDESYCEIVGIKGHAPFCAYHHAEDHSSSSFLLLMVDLNDTVNWPHINTGEVMAKAIQLRARVASDNYQIRFGVLVDKNVTEGTVHFFDAIDINGTTTPTDMRIHDMIFPNGIDLSVDTAALKFLAGGWKETFAGLKTGDLIDTVTGGVAEAEIGDVIMHIYDAGSSGANLDIEAKFFYDTQG